MTVRRLEEHLEKPRHRCSISNNNWGIVASVGKKVVGLSALLRQTFEAVPPASKDSLEGSLVKTQ